MEIQRVAVRDGRALAWTGGLPPARTEIRERERAPRDYTPKHLANKILQSKSALECPMSHRSGHSVLFFSRFHLSFAPITIDAGVRPRVR